MSGLSLRLLPLVPVDVPRINEVTLDGRVLLFALTFPALTAPLAGIAPAIKDSGADSREALQAVGYVRQCPLRGSRVVSVKPSLRWTRSLTPTA